MWSLKKIRPEELVQTRVKLNIKGTVSLLISVILAGHTWRIPYTCSIHIWKSKHIGAAKDLRDFQLRETLSPLFFPMRKLSTPIPQRNYLIRLVVHWYKGINWLPPGPQHKVVQVGHYTKAMYKWMNLVHNWAGEKCIFFPSRREHLLTKPSGSCGCSEKSLCAEGWC